MDKIFITTDGTQEMNKACIDYLVSLSVSKPVYYSPSLVYKKDCKYLYLENNEITDFKRLSDKLGFIEVFLPPKQHVHYHLIVQWAKDPTKKVWKSEQGLVWRVVKNPDWDVNAYYCIQEADPTPKLTDKPLTKEQGAYLSLVYCLNFFNTCDGKYYTTLKEKHVPKELYDKKLIFATPEAANQAAKKVLNFLTKEYE